MGVCKCKKKTTLFCFVHKKPVCEECISTDHSNCVIKTYLEWLQNSEYESLSCVVCHEKITEKPTRLLCLDIIHAECLEIHLRSLKQNNSPITEYTCPSCLKHLSQFSGQYKFLTRNLLTPFSVVPELIKNINLDKIESVENVPISSSEQSVIASRKPQKSTVKSDSDEDKYRKRTIPEVLGALGIVDKTPEPAPVKQRRTRFSLGRVVFLFALFSTIITVIMLYTVVISTS